MIDESSNARRTGLESADWYRALSLRERLGLSSHDLAKGGGSDGVRERLARWKAQPPFATTSLFPQRLAADQIPQPDRPALLAGSPQSLCQRAACPASPARVERTFPGPSG